MPPEDIPSGIPFEPGVGERIDGAIRQWWGWPDDEHCDAIGVADQGVGGGVLLPNGYAGGVDLLPVQHLEGAAAYEADDGAIVGSVLAIVTPIMFYERKQATVVQFYCKAPGYGVKLLRQLLAWCQGRRIIRMVVFTLEVRADPRIGKLLRRLGLTSELPVYMKIL